MHQIQFNVPVGMDMDMNNMFEQFRHDAMQDMPQEFKQMFEDDFMPMGEMRHQHPRPA